MSLVGWQPDDVYSLCEKINLLVKEQDYSLVADNLSVSISIGIVNADTSSDFEHLLRCADNALFQVKNAGRDGISVHEQSYEYIA